MNATMLQRIGSALKSPKVVKFGHPSLAGVAAPFTKQEIADLETTKLIHNMRKAMEKENGIGIAAPQLSVSKQLFLVDVPSDPKCPRLQAVPFMPLFNPKWWPMDNAKFEHWESCLSVPDMWGLVERYKKVKVSFLDQNGKEKLLVATGTIAGLFQHEGDHLVGVTFLQRLKSLSPTTLLHDEEHDKVHNPADFWGTLEFVEK